MLEASGCCDKLLVSLDAVSTLFKQNQLNIYILWLLQVVSVSRPFCYFFFSGFVFDFFLLFFRYHDQKHLSAFACSMRHQCNNKQTYSCVFVSVLLSTYQATTVRVSFPHVCGRDGGGVSGSV